MAGPLRRHGVSLAELVVAISLLALAFVVLMNLMASLSASRVRASQETQAQAIAQQYLEEARAGAFSTLPPGHHPAPAGVSGDHLPGRAGSAGRFRGRGRTS